MRPWYHFQRFAWLRERRAIPVLVALFVAFLALSLLVHSPELLEVDRAITRAIQGQRTGWLDGAARLFTFAGSIGILAAGGVVALVLFWRAGHPRGGILCLATLLSYPLNVAIKDWVERPRPDASLVEVLLPAIGLSFPSGHAMTSAAFFGFLAFMAWVHIQQRTRRRFWTAAAALMPVGISLSRIYLGAHWFSDVLGGWTAGLCLVLLLAEIYKAIGTAELVPKAIELPHHGKVVRAPER